ncbi:MAG: glycosyltransferase [Candidatus Thiodiazotropha sp.]
MDRRPRIACFLATSGHSGVDRLAKNLLPGMAQAGFPVDLLKIRNHGPTLDGDRPANLRVIEFKSRHVYPALPELIRYLRQTRPDVLLTDKDRVNRTAILAQALSGTKTRLVLRSGTTVSANLASRDRLDRFMQRNSMRYLYRRAEAILTPSEGAADDFAETIGLPRERITAVPSPIITPRFLAQLDQPLEHPWFQPGEPPVILGAGELCRRKDFTTLVRAFALLAEDHDCRLMILGEGRVRERLEREIRRHRLEERVSLPGFVANPYPYMKHASLFVLSSLWEGMGNVLIEAMAAETPVVSTDCPSGPSELLGGLSAEVLVKPGDFSAMAHAMAGQLESPVPAAELLAAVAAYRLENSVSAYLDAMGLSVH